MYLQTFLSTLGMIRDFLKFTDTLKPCASVLLPTAVYGLVIFVMIIFDRSSYTHVKRVSRGTLTLLLPVSFFSLFCVEYECSE